MSKNISKSRRNFLKTSAGAVAATAMVPRKIVAAPQPDPVIINPNISNLRVVCCHDPDMVDGNPTSWRSVADQNETVKVSKVQANMDAMAMVLAQKTTAAEAWATIFQKPGSKEWSEVKVAIKPNCKTNGGSPANNPRLAIIDKVCKALNDLGVPFSSIIIYDADDEDATIYNGFPGNGLPDDVVITRRSDALGGQVSTPVPAPYNRNVDCVRDLANGTIDILVNIAVNKGHSYDFTARATLTMKNHLGTYAPIHDMDYFVGITISDAIVGGTPPRQQLCIVDSLWASSRGPQANPNKAPYRIAMGTYSPAVDYLCIKKIREDVMGETHTNSVVNQYLTEFGYQIGDVTDFINVDPVPIKSNSRINNKTVGTIKVTLPSTLSRKPFVTFDLTSTVRPIFVSIYTLKGRRIKMLPLSASSSNKVEAVWDGCDFTGARVGTGTYVITVRQDGNARSKKIELIRS